MKRLLTLLTTSFLCITASGQGRIDFNNDSLHLVYWGPSAGALAGQAVSTDNMVPGLTGIAVDFYLGTSSSQLFLYSSTTMGTLAAGAGRWPTVHGIINPNAATGAPGFPGGTAVFVDVLVHSTEKASPIIFDPAAIQTFQAFGYSVEIPVTLGSGITPPLLTTTWPRGTFNMDQYGVGSRGAVEVNVPEPTTFALACLGSAAMLLFRRRT